MLVVLFDRPAAALAAPLGEIVFAEFLLGEFEGIGEFEEVVVVAAALYLAARLVRDPTRPRSYALAALFVAGVSGLAAIAIDVLKMYVGVGTAFRETTGPAGQASGAAPPLALAAIAAAVVLGLGLLLALRRGWLDGG